MAAHQAAIAPIGVAAHLVVAHELRLGRGRAGAPLRREQPADAAVPDLRASLRLRPRHRHAAVQLVRRDLDPDADPVRTGRRSRRTATAPRHRHRAHDRQFRRVRCGQQPGVAVRRRDHLRHRQRAGHVVCLDRNPRVAPVGRCRRRSVGCVGCDRCWHGGRATHEWSPRGGDTVADHVSVRARHRSGVVARGCPGGYPRNAAACGRVVCTRSHASMCRQRSGRPSSAPRPWAPRRSWWSVGCSASRRRSSTTS